MYFFFWLFYCFFLLLFNFSCVSSVYLIPLCIFLSTLSYTIIFVGKVQHLSSKEFFRFYISMLSLLYYAAFCYVVSLCVIFSGLWALFVLSIFIFICVFIFFVSMFLRILFPAFPFGLLYIRSLLYSIFPGYCVCCLIWSSSYLFLFLCILFFLTVVNLLIDVLTFTDESRESFLHY